MGETKDFTDKRQKAKAKQSTHVSEGKVCASEVPAFSLLCSTWGLLEQLSGIKRSAAAARDRVFQRTDGFTGERTSESSLCATYKTDAVPATLLSAYSIYEVFIFLQKEKLRFRKTVC